MQTQEIPSRRRGTTLNGCFQVAAAVLEITWLIGAKDWVVPIRGPPSAESDVWSLLSPAASCDVSMNLQWHINHTIMHPWHTPQQFCVSEHRDPPGRIESLLFYRIRARIRRETAASCSRRVEPVYLLLQAQTPHILEQHCSMSGPAWQSYHGTPRE